MPKKFASMTDQEAENAFSTSPRMRRIHGLFVESQDGRSHSSKRTAVRALMEEVFSLEDERLEAMFQVDVEKKKYIDLLARLDRTEAEFDKPASEAVVSETMAGEALLMKGRPQSTTRDDLLAVLQKRSIVRASGCWEWQGSCSKAGYGQLSRVRLSVMPLTIHRLSFQLHYGEIPDGLCVLHRCDNPPCWNPEHLFLGTHQDNVNDKIAKGRMRHGHVYGSANYLSKHHPRGLDHPGHVLTPDLVREIRKLAATEGTTAIAKRFGVSRGCVAGVLKGKNWKEIQ